MKKILGIAAVCVLVFSACAAQRPDDGRLSVVTTIFPPYDFARAISGGKASLTMLLKPGAESHSYEPTPQDIITIGSCDIFIYVGGESDEWVSDVLESVDTSNIRIITLMDCVDVVEEEIVEGMEEEEEEEEGIAYDEHVRTSPRNAKLIVQKIADALCAEDGENSELYRANTASYLSELDALDADFRSVAEQIPLDRRVLVFGDRFPFRYFVDAYDFKYFAAFPGCSTETECSAATVAFLIDKVADEKIPAVFYIEFSNENIAGAICEATGAAKRLFHSVHNIRADDFTAGKTYLDIMKQNVVTLRETYAPLT
jgi:zinc transport system substrate-binding protein